MGNTFNTEPREETEEHFSESCCIVYTGRTANGAYKYVRKCSCSQNLPHEELYHHSYWCKYFWRRNYHGRCIIKMKCYCRGPSRSYHR